MKAAWAKCAIPSAILPNTVTDRTGPRLITAETKAEMKRVLQEIQQGTFARDFLVEARMNYPQFKAMRRMNAEHPIEQVGTKLRAMMPWLKK